jgi:hypothetical protein
MFHFWCPVPVSVRTNEQTYRGHIVTALVTVLSRYWFARRTVTAVRISFSLTGKHARQSTGNPCTGTSTKTCFKNFVA